MKTQILLIFTLITTLSYAQTRIASGINGPVGIQVIDDYVYTLNNSSLIRYNKSEVSTSYELVSNISSSTNGYNLWREGNYLFMPFTGIKGVNVSGVIPTIPIQQINVTSTISTVFHYNNELYYTGSNPSNSSQHELRKVTGINSSVFVASLPVAHQNITDVTLDGSTLYFVFNNLSTGKIYKIDLSATTPAAQIVKSGLPAPWGIHFVDDYLYFTSNLTNGQIRKIHKSGAGSVYYIGQPIESPRGIDIDGQDIYVASVGSSLQGIYKYTDANLTPNCVAPSNVFKTIDDETTTTISWNGVYGALSYDVTYVNAGDDVSTGTTITGVTTTSTVLSGLTNGNEYDVYVKTNCASATTSDYSNYINFTQLISSQRPIIYVDYTASGSNDGSSWADAFTDIQDALTTVIEGSNIWIAKGTYKASASNRDATFDILKENVSIYGGFAGTENSIEDRVLGANATILSGDLNDNDVNVTDFPSNYGNSTRNGDNSYHLINITATGESLLLDGLTISDAHTNVSATETGGAIIKDKSIYNLTLKNCIIKDNVSRNTNAGLLAEFELNNPTGQRASLVIENCQFINNMSREGSGIYMHAKIDTNVDVTITNTLFDSNVAADLSDSNKGYGASVAWIRSIGANADVNVNIVNNTYVNNIENTTTFIAGKGSTLAISKSGPSDGAINAIISNSIFWGNKDLTTTGNVVNSVNALNESLPNSLAIYNSIDERNFIGNAITHKASISYSNPLFVNAANSNFTLQTGSPAINTGDNTKIPTSITKDLLGNQRIFDTTVDMGVYEFGSSVLGVNDNFNVFKSDVTVYPNPTVSNLNIKMDSNLKRAIVYSVLGNKVLETTSKKITTSNLKSGLYLIKIEDENGTVSTKKFIKK